MSWRDPHRAHLRVLKKALGVLLVVYGLVALFTPFTPGAWLAILGANYLGVRLLFWERLRAKLSTPPWPAVTIAASVVVSLAMAGVLYAYSRLRG